jgi:hypothetical protein
MDKVKFALTVLSVLIIAVPLLVVVYAYQNNLEGLAIPPQIQSLLTDGLNSGNSGSGNGAQMPQVSQSIPNFQLPQAVGQPQYDPATGAFSYPFNFTNPLTSQISINDLSAEVVGENNTPLGNVSITPVNIAAGASTVINATGNLSQSAINQLETEYQNGSLNVSLQNVNVNLGGITVHINEINDIGSILGQYGISTTTG